MMQNLSGKTQSTIIIALSLLVIIGVAWFIISKNTPSELQLVAGDKVVITVMAESIEDMYGYQFQLLYNQEQFELSGVLQSEISEIETIFFKPFDEYILIGATKVGEQLGSSGKNQKVCSMTLTALTDCTISGNSISLNDVRVVSSELAYTMDVVGWSYKFSLEMEVND